MTRDMTIDGIYIVAFSVSVVVALLITPWIIWTAVKFECLDMPSARKVHQRPMVRLGGVAIFGATVVSTVVSILGLWAIDATDYLGDTALSTSLSISLSTIALLLLGGSGFFLIGFVDDLFDLSAFNRLWMQGAIASAIWMSGVRIDQLVLPGVASPIALGWLSLPLTILWLVGVVNAINWIDGLDGLAAGVSGIAALVIVLIGVTTGQPVPALLGSALLGGLLGFLYYNYSPAKIFMGDGGAYFVGFMLASLCMVGPMQLESDFATLLPLVILAVPLADMTSVIAVRLYRRCSPFCADQRHLHHRLLAMALTHQAAVWVLYGLTLVTGMLSLVLVGMANRWALLGAIALLVILLLAQMQRVARFQESDIVVTEELWYSKNL